MSKIFPRVTFEPMLPEAYEDWYEYGVKAFAADKVKAHDYAPEKAMELSSESMSKGLPDGLATKDQHIFNIHDEEGNKIGAIWFAIKQDYGKQYAFLYDIEIIENKRGLGFGRATMQEFEKKVASMGIKQIGLHTFGFNRVATGLYASLGYRVTDITMFKDI